MPESMPQPCNKKHIKAAWHVLRICFMNWSDLRVFLAVAQLGSLRQAAGMLGVTQPTIARRIQTLEHDLGIPLFHRTREGHRLTAAGADLLPEARAVESAGLRFEQRALGLLTGLTQTVRVGVGETAAAVLARGLHLMTDGPIIELIDPLAPIDSRAPDILLRHGVPKVETGITRRVGSISCAIYGARKLAENRTLPLLKTDLVSLPWLGFTEEQEHYVTMRWMRKLMRDRPPAARLMNTNLMATAAAAGVGIAVLPCFVGNAETGLTALSAQIDALQADYWTVTQPDLSRNESVRAVAEWIIKCFRATTKA